MLFGVYVCYREMKNEVLTDTTSEYTMMETTFDHFSAKTEPEKVLYGKFFHTYLIFILITPF